MCIEADMRAIGVGLIVKTHSAAWVSSRAVMICQDEYKLCMVRHMAIQVAPLNTKRLHLRASLSGALLRLTTAVPVARVARMHRQIQAAPPGDANIRWHHGALMSSQQ